MRKWDEKSISFLISLSILKTITVIFILIMEICLREQAPAVLFLPLASPVFVVNPKGANGRTDYQYSLFGTKEALGFNLHGCGSGVGPFLVLYPAGITSEVGVIHICLHYIKYKLINYAGTL
ncbi:uncharacterized protein LOC113274627 isoform X2 [Papaver somniferum]|uniref:uncharacterized protein LOC113274627 isoform X2 n=1 Tax=Papaver somniferum TaxID=3469 RepID=UPI000E6FB79A|nr:uncharacterized protein LOC113274627 isoform X2 [Papaver somniferum]